MLDAKTDKAIAGFTERVKSLLGPDLVAVLLYGSAAGESFNRKRSDINFMIVVGEIAPVHLERLAKELPGWRKKRIATPLLVDRPYLKQALDVFPIEFSEISSCYKVLAGEDVLAGLQPDARNLRYQCEHEARGKLLRLREIYLDVGNDKKRLRFLMIDSVKTFLIIMRAFLRLAGEEVPGRQQDTVARVEEITRSQLPTVRHVLAVRAGGQPWRSEPAQRTFFAYHDEIRQFVATIDRFLIERPTQS